MDPTRCRAEVWDRTGWPRAYQCNRKAVIDGQWCKQHDPAAVKARRDASDARSDAEWRKRRYEIYGKSFYDALVEIAEGHNDPRSLAHQVVDKFNKP